MTRGWRWALMGAVVWAAPAWAAGSLGVGGGGFYPTSSTSCALTQVVATAGHVNYTVVDCSAGGEAFGLGFYYPPDNPATLTPKVDVHMGSGTGNACVTVEIGCCGDGSTARNCDSVSYQSLGTADTVAVTTDGISATKQFTLSAVTPQNAAADRWCMARVKRQTQASGCTTDTYGADLRVRAIEFTW